MDIKELATLTAAEMDDIYLRNVPANILEQYATRLIAAYLAEQKPVAWEITETVGNKIRTLISRQGPNSVSDDDKAEFDVHFRPLVYSAPPEPAPQQQKPQTTIGEPADPAQPAAVCAAPSYEEVKRIVGDTFEASMSDQSGEIGPITLRKRNAIHAVVWDSVNAVLAARVPDGCVVVPRKATKQIRDALRVGSHLDFPSDALCDVRWAAAIAAVAAKSDPA